MPARAFMLLEMAALVVPAGGAAALEEAGRLEVGVALPLPPPVPVAVPVAVPLVEDAGPVAVDAGAEPVADPEAGGGESVTPTAAQSCCAAAWAAWRSALEHVLVRQAVTLVTKAWFLHRQALSVAWQPPRSAPVMHWVAQGGS